MPSQDQAIAGFSFAGGELHGSAVAVRLQNDKDVIMLAYFDSSQAGLFFSQLRRSVGNQAAIAVVVGKWFLAQNLLQQDSVRHIHDKTNYR